MSLLFFIPYTPSSCLLSYPLRCYILRVPLFSFSPSSIFHSSKVTPPTHTHGFLLVSWHLWVIYMKHRHVWRPETNSHRWEKTYKLCFLDYLTQYNCFWLESFTHKFHNFIFHNCYIICHCVMYHIFIIHSRKFNQLVKDNFFILTGKFQKRIYS